MTGNSCCLGFSFILDCRTCIFKVIIVLTRNNRRFTDKTYTLPHNLLKEKNHEDGYEEKKPEVDGGKI